ncbi:Sas10/Utp3/C1D family-domain-containing protein [Bombardia bombarda]|uniref:Exosome complex protein n=1 Tax=Bombardia bombarda TaxID=252184 RepID=A0AA39X8F6_9PEZI|nr:Sas10/Utp3/C1D family-domain-containing protein [Bombardia bombarda]
MDITDITPQLDQLDIDLKQLQEALKPLLGDVGDVSSRLPLLDKAKLYVLFSYAIESLLFSSLRLNGVETKNHAIFAELTRVKQYFDKINDLENPPPPRETTLNTTAAIRFVRSDLVSYFSFLHWFNFNVTDPDAYPLQSDNKEVRGKLTEQIAKERPKIAAKPSQAPKAWRRKEEKSTSPQKPTKMPRQRSSGGGRAPSRPTVPSRAPAPQQTRPATTYAPSAQQPHAPTATPQTAAPTSSGGGSMLGNIASTAAGVAIGSTIGHAVSGLFGGSSSAAEPQQSSVSAQDQNQNNSSWGNNCQTATQSFTKCLDDNSGNMQICGWYLEQLKACQAAASQY